MDQSLKIVLTALRIAEPEATKRLVSVLEKVGGQTKPFFKTDKGGDARMILLLLLANDFEKVDLEPNMLEEIKKQVIASAPMLVPAAATKTSTTTPVRGFGKELPRIESSSQIGKSCEEYKKELLGRVTMVPNEAPFREVLFDGVPHVLLATFKFNNYADMTFGADHIGCDINGERLDRCNEAVRENDHILTRSNKPQRPHQEPDIICWVRAVPLMNGMNVMYKCDFFDTAKGFRRQTAIAYTVINHKLVDTDTLMKPQPAALN